MADPDHMAGINSLPRWNPDNLGAGYRYDSRNYDPRDYAAFKAARAAADKARQAKAEKALGDLERLSPRACKCYDNLVMSYYEHRAVEKEIAETVALLKATNKELAEVNHQLEMLPRPSGIDIVRSDLIAMNHRR
jgi:hypothetical protein